ncbi:unnamed protein product [Orchesella dallaii]|uniref:Serine/threonine-protein phosphatase 6 regulatory subunit 3 n=1 Tax=Orchesella dallaii TaxID=48710 RepID=A0ABP1PW77_9HEXA
MFWHSAANSNAIDNLLDQPDVNLTTILDQDEVLMEIRGMNKKLLEFLTRPECMYEMVDLITTVPSADIPLPLQYKYPNTACEVLTSDISFAEKIAAEHTLMGKLFHFFRDSEPPLNPLLASYVGRVLGEMIARKLDQNWYSYQLNLIQVMGYLQSEPSLLDWLLKHLETSAVCDFLHKLVMHVEGQDMRANLYEWLEVREKFFMKLVNSMDRLHSRESHMNVSRLVGDLLFALQDESSSSSQDRSMDSEPFLLALKSNATFERLLDVIFGEDTLSQSSIVYGLEMLLALLGIAKKPMKLSSKIDTTFDSHDDITIPYLVRGMLISKMETLLRFLQCPPNARQAIRLSNGVLKEPLGMERLAIVRFIAHVITLHDVELNEALIQSGVLRKALDLFWEYPWNNFLHHYVCQILIQISKITRSNNCAKFVLIDYNFLGMVMDAFEDEGLKCGYMGHLAKIASTWIECLETNDAIKSLLPELDDARPDFRDKFQQFYSEKWKAYHAKSIQLLAGAALPTSGVSISSNNHNYESDPGVTWDSSNDAGMSADNDNNVFYEPSSSSNYATTDRYDDEKSKAIFEMFCFERTNSTDDDEDDCAFRSDENAAPNAASYEAEDSPDATPDDMDLEWKNPDIFMKRLEEQEELFSQLNLNGTLGDASCNTVSPASFIANPWAGQESVQIDNTDPWAAFEFSDDAATDHWAKFDQSFNTSTEFGDFSGGIDVFSTASEPTPTTPNPNDAVTPPQEDEAKQSQL